MALRDPTEHLDPKVRRLWAVQDVLGALGVGAAGAVLLVGADAAGADVGGAGVALVIVATVAALGRAAWAPGLRWRHHRFEVLDEGLYIASGWLVRRHHLVPHARVQTVDTRSDPLMRAFGLVEVQVRTASHQGSVTLPGLASDVADDLVAVLAARAGHDQAT